MLELNLSIEGNKKESIKLKKFNKKLTPNLKRGIDKATLRLERHIKSRKLSGQVLKPRTGRLRSSWARKAAVDKPGVGVQGRVGTNVVYARIHEFGGVIRPKSSDGWLRFKIGGSWVTVKSVTIPARPYVGPTIREKKDEVTRDIVREIMKPLR